MWREILSTGTSGWKWTAMMDKWMDCQMNRLLVIQMGTLMDSMVILMD